MSNRIRDLPKFPKTKMVCVDWEDAANNTGYYDKGHPEYTTTINARTIGYLLEKNKKVVKIGSETFEDGGFRHINSIPGGMVRKITVLSMPS